MAALAAVAWVYLLLFHGGFWHTTHRLPPRAGLNGWPSVVAVVPARNEADMLPLALPTLLAQKYPGELSIVVVDDCSDDGTGTIAAKLGAESDRDLRVVGGKPRPGGWAGKVWAMRQGLDQAPASDYVLFTDADIACTPGTLKDLVAAAETDDRDLVSQMALLRADSGWERLLVPAFVYFFAQLYPFRRVSSSRWRTGAAAGGCMLVRRDALDRAGGIDQIANALIDDVALGQLLKRQRRRVWLGLTTQVTSVRPYDTLDSLWRMVARSAYTQLRYSPLLLAGTVLGLGFSYVLPPVAMIVGLAVGNALVSAAGGAGWLIMAVTEMPMLRLYRLQPARAFLLPAVAVLYTAMTIDSARRHYAGRGGEWKGRTASAGLAW